MKVTDVCLRHGAWGANGGSRLMLGAAVLSLAYKSSEELKMWRRSSSWTSSTRWVSFFCLNVAGFAQMFDTFVFLLSLSSTHSLWNVLVTSMSLRSLDLIMIFKWTLLLWFLDEIFFTPPLLYSPLSDSTEHHVTPTFYQHSAPFWGSRGVLVWPLTCPGWPLAPSTRHRLWEWGPLTGEAEAPAEGPEGGSGQPAVRLAPPGEKTGRKQWEEEGSPDFHRWRTPSCQSGERRFWISLWEETMDRLETEQRETEQNGMSRVRGERPEEWSRELSFQGLLHFQLITPNSMLREKVTL